ncbi:response regulator transcription factor [Candidatus Sulfidibacterium hydrothermale]|uniref:response regulator transcription factor n=1 Tax=Candidatus Sulfidibacterium hydrothermale TaxID=2875962 RepID=UPI001F0AC84D|nr:response regulator transcription factor [Candidatus Sulfidibacterium hydrothermale]UBM62500.1 response regulator transcription factor [Candidatus Sulfidibacterium hydrothermale]
MKKKETDFSQYKILLVDDEEDIIEFLSYNLKKEGFRVFTAFDGEEAVKKAKKELPHLILMDIMMPKMDGMTAVEEIRKIGALDNTLIVFLTARAEDYSQIAGFEAGADDYVTKPVKPKVLVKRIMALLRRSRKTEVAPVERNDITIDPSGFFVMKGTEKITLPKKEFKLLHLLASKPNKVFRRDEIFHEIWGDDVIVGNRTIDVHIRKIREKLGIENIKTIKGVGYKYEE